jgi:hypothetical protein
MNPKIQEFVNAAGTDVSGKWIGVAQVPAIIDAVLADLLKNGYISQDNYDEFRSHISD